MSNLSRRHFLGCTSGVFLGVGLAGCGSSDTPATPSASSAVTAVTPEQLDAALAQLKDNLVSQWTAAHDPSINALDTSVQALQSALKTLQDTVAAQDPSTLQADLQTLQSKLDKLGTDVAAISPPLADLITTLQTQITQLQTDLSAVSGSSTITQADLLTLQTSVNNVIAQAQTQASQISSLQSAVQTAITSLTRYINVKDHGATGDGTTDDTAAFRACIADAFAKVATIFVPPGTYRITDRLKCWLFTNGIGRRSVQFLGGGGASILFVPAALNSVCIEHAEGFGFHNISVTAEQSDSANHWGIAFSTPVNTTTLEPSNAQTAFSRFSNVRLRGKFKYSFFRRFTLWDSYETIDSRESMCHFMFALSSSYDTPLADPGTGWNGGASGWFHNQVSFDNVLCEAGEVGIMGGLMGANFIQLTCQGHAGNGAQNTIIPANEAGTGVWLQGRLAGDPCRGNTFGAYYTEVTERPLKFINCTPITIGTAFWQGVTAVGANPVAPTVSLVDSSVNVLAATVRGRFINFIDATSNSRAIVQLLNGGTFTSGKYAIDGSSSVLDLNDIEADKIYRYTRAANAALDAIDLMPLATGRNYTVRIYGSANGDNVDSLYAVVGTTLSYVVAADRGANVADFSQAAGARGARILVSNNQLRISRVQAFACDLHITVERVSVITVMNEAASPLLA